MSIMVLNALLVLVGPFLVTLPIATIVWLEFSPAPIRRPVALRFRSPAFSVRVAVLR